MAEEDLDKERLEQIQQRYSSFSLSLSETELLNSLTYYLSTEKEIEEEESKIDLVDLDSQLMQNGQIEVFKSKVDDPLEVLRAYDLKKLTEAYFPKKKTTRKLTIRSSNILSKKKRKE